jgi:hypothetical protein
MNNPVNHSQRKKLLNRIYESEHLIPTRILGG